jgi:hypoxanthine phosphoribosyltransferase
MIEVITWIFGITTVLGIVLTVYFGIKSTRLEKARKKLEWIDLQTSSSELSTKVKKEFLPNVICTPGLHGATFVNILISELGEIPVFVGVSSWKNNVGAIKQLKGYFLIETNKWYVHIPETTLDFKGQNLLIVDDFAMSGDFLEKLKEFFISNGFDKKNIRTMCIATTKVAVHNHKAPDYYWMEASDDSFYFPWGKAK